MNSHVAAISLFCGFLIGCEGTENAGTVPPRHLSLGEMGVQAVIGAEPQGSPLSVFQRALDAVLLEDRIVVLDASPPFTRVFDLSGNYLVSAIAKGDGPGELRRPVSVGRFDGNSYLANEPAKLLHVSSSGQVLQTVVNNERFLRGAIGCNGAILQLSAAPGFQEPGQITVSEAGAAPTEDTLVRLDSIRSNSRRVHPLLTHARGATAVFYSEEVGRNRLVRIRCTNGDYEYVGLDSLGRQEYFELLQGGRYALHPAAVPRPAGVVGVEGALLWARQEEITAESGVDSVTLLTLMTDRGEAHEVYLGGWYQLVDSLGDRLLLIALSPVSHVMVLNQRQFFRAAGFPLTGREASDQ